MNEEDVLWALYDKYYDKLKEALHDLLEIQSKIANYNYDILSDYIYLHNCYSYRNYLLDKFNRIEREIVIPYDEEKLYIFIQELTQWMAHERNVELAE